jgi:hypothetical protein
MELVDEITKKLRTEGGIPLEGNIQKTIKNLACFLKKEFDQGTQSGI